MISYIISFFNFLFTRNADDNDNDKENFLAENLLNLEVEQRTQSCNEIEIIKDLPRNTDCFKRTGVITYMDENTILIDGLFYFDTLSCSIDIRLNDKVLYLGYKNSNNSIVVARILENQGSHWGGENFEENLEENEYKTIEHVIVGEVEYRKARFVYMKDKDLKFSLDEVEATIVPIKGDWLELNCRIQWDEEKPSDISSVQVLEVISMRPLRSRIKTAIVTEWSGDNGTCDRIIYFDKQCLQVGTVPYIGSKVILEAIESNQGACMWRATKLCKVESSESKQVIPDCISFQDPTSLLIEKEHNIDVTYPLQFDAVNINETNTIDLHIINNSDKTHIINKWIVLSKRKDSQININPVLARPRKLYPKQTFSFVITCQPKFLGNSKEHVVIMFKGFQVNRIVEINIVQNNLINNSIYGNTVSEYERIKNMKQIRNRDNNSFIAGIKPLKPPAFVPVKLGVYQIPDKVWSIVLGDSQQAVYCSDYDNILYRIESGLPCLLKALNISNYIDRWHTLLYMEEIQNNINMRAYDMTKVYLIRCNEYLALEINGLSERRPSLIKGDRAIVKDVWDNVMQQYEGFVHIIKGNLVLMKFHQSFHESYSGCDVSIEFHSSRSTFRRCHQAVNVAISNLGVDVLFPSRVLSRPQQIPKEKIESIQWYNKSLNIEQKTAIYNILLGECRPMPYYIYGPPGTGKTMTVIETILQISTLLPDSRLLIATPSNSAANLLTERLIQYRNIFPNSMIRLIANYLVDTNNVPDVIKPFCATLDIIGLEHTKKSNHIVKDEINLNCQKSFVGRHRITIGTCNCLGILAQFGFPRGHFTHVIVDEAGQATEPEILIPLNFIDKENGQIILAGDPLQLGPFVMSRYCKEYGLDESYFSRVIQTFPYQKDYDAYDSGFNNKLITRLKDNYRSLQEVLTLPSTMFYDDSLVAKLDRNQSWIQAIIDTLCGIFDSSNRTGGIYVYGIRGCNARAEDSPSWYNPQEASMVALTTCKLYKKNLSTNDIGIITPYIAQVRYIRVLFDAMGLPTPKIGSVEEFQGQERPIIIISTVRSTEAHLLEDQKNALGFVKNPKRMNVALTRAQVGVLLFCDPHLLSSDPLWKKVISHAIRDDKYMGCDLPNVFNE